MNPLDLRIQNLTQNLPHFLAKLRGNNDSAFFHYSLTGDLYGEEKKWGLANTIFAIKIYSILNQIDHFSPLLKKSYIRFIQSFQAESGYFFDPLIQQKTCLSKIYQTLTNQKNDQRIAETHQALSALNLLGEKINFYPANFPIDQNGITRYLKSLNWRKPWHAGSYFSHLLFFLSQSKLPNQQNLIQTALHFINHLESDQDGAWYCGNVSPAEKINGAMKVITAFENVQTFNIHYPRKIIDLILKTNRYRNACDYFNATYVLYHALRKENFEYQNLKVKNYLTRQIKLCYQNFFYPQYSAFSFHPHRANQYFYGFKVSRGFSEPDIHGTLMFLGMLAICQRLLHYQPTLKMLSF